VIGSHKAIITDRPTGLNCTRRPSGGRARNGHAPACRDRLGGGPADEVGRKMPVAQPITVDTIILCLKQILKSVVKSNKSGGRTGYLDFIVQYVR
jgi:hypothetical protein